MSGGIFYFLTLCDPIWQVTPRSSRTSCHRGLYSALTFLSLSDDVLAGARHTAAVQVLDGILWTAAGLCSNGRHRVSVLAPDLRHFSDCQLLHGPQAAGKLRTSIDLLTVCDKTINI